MSLGLKNALSIFQCKMNLIFKKYSKFVLVYIDDILIFSQNLEEHYDHLLIVFNEFVNCRLIISKKKMELFIKYIEFLGMKIGKRKTKLQEHSQENIKLSR